MNLEGRVFINGGSWKCPKCGERSGMMWLNDPTPAPTCCQGQTMLPYQFACEKTRAATLKDMIKRGVDPRNVLR